MDSTHVALANNGASLPDALVTSVVLNGDLAKLSATEKVQYVLYRCRQLGLDPSAKPFELLSLNGKQVLYATAACTQQLCESRKLSVSLVGHEMVKDVIVVTAKVSDKERSTENVGAVAVQNLAGDSLANALMKARTKAIRRTVLAHCGLGMLDETETETIPNATKVEVVTDAHTEHPSSPEPASVQPGSTEEPPSSASDGPPSHALPGEFVIPFGFQKGKKLKDLSDDQLNKLVAWCVKNNKYQDVVDAASAYKATSDMPF